MKTYIVYVDGEEVGTIKAGSHNAAEKKAQKKYPGNASLYGGLNDPFTLMEIRLSRNNEKCIEPK